MQLAQTVQGECMPRKLLSRSALNPYHVYNRTVDRNFYGTEEMPKIWSYCCDLLYEASVLHDAKIHAFVLMSNHFHLLLSTPAMNLDVIMRDFQSKLCKMVLREKEKQQFRFSGPYKWLLIKSGMQYSNVYKYICQNPLRAGLVIRCEEYPYSTFSSQLGMSKAKIPLSPSELYEGALPLGLDELSDWVRSALPLPILLETRGSCVRVRKIGG